MPASPESAGSVGAPGGSAAKLQPFEYAIVRVIPRVERGEGFNAGIVLLSRAWRYLGAQTQLDEAVLVAMSPDCDVESIRDHLATIERIAAGEPAAGPIALLTPPERFHWLVSPSSTIIAAGPVHTGITADPAATLEHLMRTLVRR